jgi:hypothetical protein
MSIRLARAARDLVLRSWGYRDAGTCGRARAFEAETVMPNLNGAGKILMAHRSIAGATRSRMKRRALGLVHVQRD